MSFAYDAADQTTSINGTGMSYRGAGQVERVTSGGTSYQYDLTGLAVMSNASGTTYVTRTPVDAHANSAMEGDLFVLGFFLDQEGRSDEAEEHYQAAIAADNDVFAHDSYGWFLMRHGRDEEVDYRLCKALEAGEGIKTHDHLAELLERQGRVDEARELRGECEPGRTG